MSDAPKKHIPAKPEHKDESAGKPDWRKESEPHPEGPPPKPEPADPAHPSLNPPSEHPLTPKE